MTYLDHNASSPLLPQARSAWLEAEERYPGNAASPHRIGARADAALDEARQRLGLLLGCSPLDVIWTSGATEACNTVVHHAAATRGPETEVWIGAGEHPAVLESAQRHFAERVRLIPLDSQGVTDLNWLEQRIAKAKTKPALVAVMAANNETGGLQPWRDVQAWCEAWGVPYFCDATQWCGRQSVNGLGAGTFVAGSAHKFGGPRGVGFLKCTPAAGALTPLLRGGKQQQGRRAGTENVPGVLAAIAALEWCEQQIAAGADAPRRKVRERFERELTTAVPGTRINGGKVDRLWNTVSVVMPEADCRQRWVVKLDKAGFAVSTGSACASGSEQASHVLTAMGLSAAEAGRALRFSSGWLTGDAAWTDLLKAVVRVQAERPDVARRA